MGLVTPVGNDVASTWAALVAGESGAGPITRFDHTQLPVHFACEVKGYDPLQYIEKKEARRYDLFSHFTIGAAVQAVRDACLEKSPLDPKRIGVIIGSGTGGIATFEDNMRAFIQKGPRRGPPFFVPVVMGDGGAGLILEEWERAKGRGAKIIAEIVGYGATADAHHITAPAPDGSGAQEAMRLAMQSGNIRPEEVGYINAHGTSTPHGDAAETAAVKAVFGTQAKKLIFGSTKSMTGPLLGAAGAFEAAICALALQNGVIPPTINQFNPDPACDLDSAPNKAVNRQFDVALSNSFGFGGHNVTLAIRRAP